MVIMEWVEKPKAISIPATKEEKIKPEQKKIKKEEKKPIRKARSTRKAK